ncbi:MAG: hypothetical protein JWR75_1813 [Devosia sp.]|nr:hypothetical protein [Devosia sp.]
MPLRWQEVAVPLAVILGLIILKYIPATAYLPLGRTAGIVSFAYAMFLALRLVQREDPGAMDGRWSELRASPVELFGAIVSGGFSALLLLAVIVNGSTADLPYGQMALGMALSISFALCAAGIVYFSILDKTRWDGKGVEHTTPRGQAIKLAWSEITHVRTTWRGITLFGTTGRISFSPFHSGAAALVKLAKDKIRRNASLAARAFTA